MERLQTERERSPNYPAHGLQSAVEFVKQAYTKVKRVPVPMDSLARALGSGSLTGPARSKIAALRSFGLIEKGKEGLRIADSALPLILKLPTDPEFVRAARAAAMNPPLFQQLSAQADLDDEEMAYYLVTQGFSQDGAARAVRSFRETMAFANLERTGYNEGTTSETAEETPLLSVQTPSQAHASAAMKAAFEASAGLVTEDVRFTIRGVLDARISFPQGASKQAIDRLMAYLKLAREDYPDTPPAAIGSSENVATEESEASE